MITFVVNWCNTNKNGHDFILWPSLVRRLLICLKHSLKSYFCVRVVIDITLIRTNCAL